MIYLSNTLKILISIDLFLQNADLIVLWNIAPCHYGMYDVSRKQ